MLLVKHLTRDRCRTVWVWVGVGGKYRN